MTKLREVREKLRELTFGGSRVDIPTNFDLEIPYHFKEIYSKISDFFIEHFLADFESKKKDYKKHLELPRVYIDIFETNNANKEDVVRKYVNNRLSIAGGSISDLAINKVWKTNYTPKDIDVFASKTLMLDYINTKNNKTEGSFIVDDSIITDEVLSNILVSALGDQCKGNPVVKGLDEKKEYRETKKIISVSNIKIDDVSVDLIVSKEAETTEIIESFDLSIRKFWYDGTNVNATKGAVFDLKNKRLHVCDTKTNIRTLIRCYKFEERYNFYFDPIQEKTLIYSFLLNEFKGFGVTEIISRSKTLGIEGLLLTLGIDYDYKSKTGLKQDAATIDLLKYIKTKNNHCEYDLLNKYLLFKFRNISKNNDFEERFSRQLPRSINLASKQYFLTHNINKSSYALNLTSAYVYKEKITNNKDKLKFDITGINNCIELNKWFKPTEKEAKEDLLVEFLVESELQDGISFFHSSESFAYFVENDVHKFFTTGIEVDIKQPDLSHLPLLFGDSEIHLSDDVSFNKKDVDSFRKKLSLQNRFKNNHKKHRRKTDFLDTVEYFGDMKTIGIFNSTGDDFDDARNQRAEVEMVKYAFELVDLSNKVEKGFDLNNINDISNWLRDSLLNSAEYLDIFSNKISIKIESSLYNFFKEPSLYFSFIPLTFESLNIVGCESTSRRFFTFYFSDSAQHPSGTFQGLTTISPWKELFRSSRLLSQVSKLEPISREKHVLNKIKKTLDINF